MSDFNQSSKWDEEDCSYLLRSLEREAFSTVVSAFRAQGRLNAYREILLDHLKTAFFIPDDLYQSELRRAGCDDSLTKIATILNPSYDVNTEWYILTGDLDEEVVEWIPPARSFDSTSTFDAADSLLELANSHNRSVQQTDVQLSELLNVKRAPYVPEKLRKLLRDTETIPQQRIVPQEVVDERRVTPKQPRRKKTKEALAAPVSTEPQASAECAKKVDTVESKTEQVEENDQQKQQEILKAQELFSKITQQIHDEAKNGQLLENGRKKRKNKQAGEMSDKESATCVCARVVPFVFEPATNGKPKPPRGNPDKRYAISTKRSSPAQVTIQQTQPYALSPVLPPAPQQYPQQTPLTVPRSASLSSSPLQTQTQSQSPYSVPTTTGTVTYKRARVCSVSEGTGGVSVSTLEGRAISPRPEGGVVYTRGSLSVTQPNIIKNRQHSSSGVNMTRPVSKYYVSGTANTPGTSGSVVSPSLTAVSAGSPVASTSSSPAYSVSASATPAISTTSSVFVNSSRPYYGGSPASTSAREGMHGHDYGPATVVHTPVPPNVVPPQSPTHAQLQLHAQHMHMHQPTVKQVVRSYRSTIVAKTSSVIGSPASGSTVSHKMVNGVANHRRIPQQAEFHVHAHHNKHYRTPVVDDPATIRAVSSILQEATELSGVGVTPEASASLEHLMSKAEQPRAAGGMETAAGITVPAPSLVTRLERSTSSVRLECDEDFMDAVPSTSGSAPVHSTPPMSCTSAPMRPSPSFTSGLDIESSGLHLRMQPTPPLPGVGGAAVNSPSHGPTVGQVLRRHSLSPAGLARMTMERHSPLLTADQARVMQRMSPGEQSSPVQPTQQQTVYLLSGGSYEQIQPLASSTIRQSVEMYGGTVIVQQPTADQQTPLSQTEARDGYDHKQTASFKSSSYDLARSDETSVSTGSAPVTDILQQSVMEIS